MPTKNTQDSTISELQKHPLINLNGLPFHSKAYSIQDTGREIQKNKRKFQHWQNDHALVGGNEFMTSN